LIRFFYSLHSLFFIGSFLFADLPKPPDTLPFIVGERLEYDLKWGFFPVGSAKMEVLAKDPSMPNGSLLIRFKVRTNSFADNFYKVRTSIVSTVDSSFTRSLYYEKSQHEGSTTRNITVSYDYDKGEAVYTQNNDSPIRTSIPGPVFDPLSIAYYFRLFPLQPDTEAHIPTCDGKKFRQIVVRAGKKEKLKLPLGKVIAISTIPSLENLGGVFNKSPNGLLKVWYSGDHRKLPVRISSKVVVGRFTATLVSAFPPLDI